MQGQRHYSLFPRAGAEDIECVGSEILGLWAAMSVEHGLLHVLRTISPIDVLVDSLSSLNEYQNCSVRFSDYELVREK